jgi:hypothetical protein
MVDIEHPLLEVCFCDAAGQRSRAVDAAVGFAVGLPSRSAWGQTGCSLPRVWESSAGEQGHVMAQADKFVDQPATTLFVPPKRSGGTLSAKGAICAIRMTVACSS